MAFQPRVVLGARPVNVPFVQPTSRLTAISTSQTAKPKKKKSGDKKSGERYNASADLPPEYAPFRKRGSGDRILIGEEQDALRGAGAKHIDLWLNPILYPPHPVTGHLPPASSLPSLVRWMYDESMADYLWALHNAGLCASAKAQASAQDELAVKLARLQLESDKARKEAQAAVNQALGERLLVEARMEELQKTYEQELKDISEREAQSISVHAGEVLMLKEQLAAVEQEVEKTLRQKVQEKEQEMRVLLDKKVAEIEALELVERLLRSEQEKLSQQLETARKNGGKLRNRVGKDYADLKKGGGAEKKRRREAL